MPTVILRRNDTGDLVFYVAKKDLEETVVAMEYQGPERWGGEVELKDGARFYIEPFEQPPRLPLTVRVRRI